MRTQMTAEEWYRRGIRLLDFGDPDEAVAAFEEAINIDDSPDAWVGKGLVFEKAGRLDAALGAFDESLRAKPNARAWWHRGIVLRELGRRREALDAYAHALDERSDEHFLNIYRDVLQQERKEIWEQLGHEFVQSHRYAEALAVYDEALEAGHTRARVWLGRSVCLTHLERTGEAMIALQQAWRAVEPDETNLANIIADGLRSFGLTHGR
jgi:tetratricopeptide (TPR) repeat protein